LDDLTEEYSVLISKILEKTKTLEVHSDSPFVASLLSGLSNLPAKRIITSVKIPNLPKNIFPSLETADFIGPDGIENLIDNFDIFKTIKSLSVSGYDSVKFNPHPSTFSKLEKVSFVDCGYVEFRTSEYKNLKYVSIRGSKLIQLGAVLGRNVEILEIDGGQLIDPIVVDVENISILAPETLWRSRKFAFTQEVRRLTADYFDGMEFTDVLPPYWEELVFLTKKDLVPNYPKHKKITRIRKDY
jgi:hypothetical protein